MEFLSATEQQIPAIRRAIADYDLGAVYISPPFMGRSIVQCPDERSAARIKHVLAGYLDRDVRAQKT